MSARLSPLKQLSTSLHQRGRATVHLEAGHWGSKDHRRWNSSLRTQSSAENDSRVIFSGIQPTGVPHIGNYLGALREWVRLQKTTAPGTKLFFSIVDLHALTIPQDHHQFRKWRKESFATLLAIGLDPTRSTLFYQSAVSCVVIFISYILAV